jgi:DNA helicase IV
VQGSPGTGKTVVAAHRAAYLTHPEREPAPLQRVALVGPTDQYVQHVSDAVRELTFGVSLIDSPTGAQQKVNVMSLPNLLFELAGLPPNPTLDERESERLDTDWRLGRIVEKAASILKSEIQFPSNKAKAVKTLVDAIAHHDRRIRGYLESESDFEQWIIGIGSYDRARTKRRFLPFLAAAGLAVRPTKTTVQFDHLICDEAQDVRPLEWRILGKYLRPNAGLSLFGDINQRHSDWSPSTWHQLATDLELTDDDGGFEPEILTLGLRTTRQIVKFANQLLPSGERTVHALREGAEPTVRRVAFSGLAPDAAADAEALSLRYPEGQVAVISVTPRLVEDALRSRGWTRSNRPLAWSKEGRTVLALHPDLARGLEFDGVVVVEPSSFNPNLGRHGQLYTSLTRAVHELVVLHSERLPKGL